jgi:hypothetical protein
MQKKNLVFLPGVTKDLGYAAGHVALSLRKQMPDDFDRKAVYPINLLSVIGV